MLHVEMGHAQHTSPLHAAVRPFVWQGERSIISETLCCALTWVLADPPNDREEVQDC
jgi:hypothetical protein